MQDQPRQEVDAIMEAHRDVWTISPTEAQMMIEWCEQLDAQDRAIANYERAREVWHASHDRPLTITEYEPSEGAVAVADALAKQDAQAGLDLWRQKAKALGRVLGIYFVVFTLAVVAVAWLLRRAL